MSLNKATLSEQIYEILRNDILTQKIRLGEKLTLKTLKERFDVSSTPIRDALTRLTEDGLVAYFTNVGVNVISITREDLVELYQFMGDLDSLAIRYAADSPNRTELLQELQNVLERTRVLEQLSEPTPSETEEWIENSDRFHLLFYEYCSNSRLKHAAQKLRSQLTIFSNAYESDPQIQRQIDAMHHEIFDACQAGDFALAQQLMKQHLNQSLEHALRYL